MVKQLALIFNKKPTNDTLPAVEEIKEYLLKPKFEIADFKIPNDSRKEFNEKVLTDIQKEQPILSKSEIFNAFTGKGALHDFSLSDFDNFHEFSAAKKEKEEGQFFTPDKIAQFMMNCIQPKKREKIADLTFGKGTFINFMPDINNFYGTELDTKAFKVANYLFPEAKLKNKDIRLYNPNIKFDYIIGNPPFNLKWNTDYGEINSQMYYIKKSYELLKRAGLLILIVPTSFLDSEFSNKSKIEKINERFNFICQFKLPSDAFSEVGVNNFSTKIIIMQKKSKYIEDTSFNNNYINIDYSPSGSHKIFNDYIKPLNEERKELKHRIVLENIEEKTKNKQFKDKIKKLLFDIKRNPKINPFLEECKEFINKFYTQSKPEYINFDEWEEIRIKGPDVIEYLENVLNKQNQKLEDKIKLVKNNYKLKLKAYSPKAQARLDKMNCIKEININEMVIKEIYPFEDNKYKELINKKIADKKNNAKSINDLNNIKEIKNWLDNFSMICPDKKITIKLNDKQKNDLNKAFQKKYPSLVWEQGSGKTFAGYAWYNYLLENKLVKNIFIVGPAISIRNTWKNTLKINNIDYINIDKISDIKKIKEGMVVTIPLSILSKTKSNTLKPQIPFFVNKNKIKKIINENKNREGEFRNRKLDRFLNEEYFEVKLQDFIKKYIKSKNNNIALIVDEADALTNSDSQRTKATLNCFRRVDYKLLTTATPTRNNIAELFPQLSLLFNNSYNMTCECKTKFKYSEKEAEVIEVKNNDEQGYYLKPFPAYKEGEKLFESCFNPTKITVFGIDKHNQDICNSDVLTKLLQQSFIMRSFKEIVGREPYKIKHHSAIQNEGEADLYKKIMKFPEKFYSNHFNAIDDPKKLSFLKIMRQIMLLIKASSNPRGFNEYSSNKLPGKFKKIFELLKKFNNEKVAIGVTHIPASEEYNKEIKKRFKNRKVFLIKGAYTFLKRKHILEQFEKSKNGILISTQQSLSCSISIPTCNKVIIESLQWNFPTISQYYGRFSRHNSKEKTEIHFITYKNTLDKNILALLLDKERINRFIKTLEVISKEEIYKEFDVDPSLINNIIKKYKDEEGNIHLALNWGKQKIS